MAAGRVARATAAPLSSRLRPSAFERLFRRAADLRDVALGSLADVVSTRDGHAALRSRWIVRVTQPLILVSQVQRSGGTLLGRLLDGHAECFSHAYELQWGKKPGLRRSVWPRIETGASAREAFEQLGERWIGRFLQRGGYDRGHGRHPFIFDAALHRRIFGSVYSAERPALQRAVLDSYFTAFFNAWLDYQSLYRQPKRFVTAFAPGLHMAATSREGFWRDYPDGYLISIVREPVSWFASAKSFRTRRPLVEGVDHGIRLWRDSTEATLAVHDARPDRTIVVLFEDLVRRTEDVVRRICDVTGLSFSATLLEPTYNGRPVLSDSSFEAKHGVDSAAADRSALVAPDEAAVVGQEIGPAYESVRRNFALPASG